MKKNNCPEITYDNLLNYEMLKAFLEAIPETKHIEVIAELRTKAKESRDVRVSDFNNQIKKVQEDIKKAKMPEIVVEESALPEIFKDKEFNNADYSISLAGVYKEIGHNNVQVCPAPIFVTGLVKDLNTSEELVEITFLTLNGWTKRIVPRIQISSSQRIIQLSEFGLMVNDTNSKFLVAFLCDIEMANRKLLPIINSVNKLGLVKMPTNNSRKSPVYKYVPYCDNVVYVGNNEDNERRFAKYRAFGSFEKWLDTQNEVCKHLIPKISIAAGYASILLQEIDVNPFGVHLWGDSGTGKTVALMASASIYGDPCFKQGIVYTGNSTANGLESRLGFVNSFCFYLDELSCLTARQVDQMIMLIMQGQGKMRMTRTGDTRQSYHWNLVSLSNSEMPITNVDSRGGVFTRIIQIKPQGAIFGEGTDMPLLVDNLLENYGFGAKMYIDLLNDFEILEEAKKLRRDYYRALEKHTEPKQANAASMLLASYEIARKYIYKSENYLTVEEIKPFLHSSETISQVMRTYDRFLKYVDSETNRFDDTTIPSYMNKWGQFAEHKGKDCIDIYPAKLEEYLKSIGDNLPLDQFLDGLNDRDLLIRNGRSRTNVVSVGWLEKPVRMYSIVKKLDIEEELVLADQPKELPF